MVDTLSRQQKNTYINFCPPFNLERLDNFSKHFIRKASKLNYRFNALSIDRGGTHPKC